MKRFEYTGQCGQKVGFGLVETGQVYEVTDEAAPVLEGDADFELLTGKAAKSAQAVPAWPESPGPVAPAVPPAAPAAVQSPALPVLDEQIIGFTGAPAASESPSQSRRSRSGKSA